MIKITKEEFDKKVENLIDNEDFNGVIASFSYDGDKEEARDKFRKFARSILEQHYEVSND